MITQKTIKEIREENECFAGLEEEELRKIGFKILKRLAKDETFLKIAVFLHNAYLEPSKKKNRKIEATKIIEASFLYFENCSGIERKIFLYFIDKKFVKKEENVEKMWKEFVFYSFKNKFSRQKTLSNHRVKEAFIKLVNEDIIATISAMKTLRVNSYTKHDFLS